MNDVQAADDLTPPTPLSGAERGETSAGAASDAPTGMTPAATVGAEIVPPAPTAPPAPAAQPASAASPALDAAPPCAPVGAQFIAPSGGEVVSAPPSPADELEELTLPSLVQAPAILPPGTSIDPEGRLVVAEHLGSRGRVNAYRATFRPDAGEEIEVELRDGPADDPALQREAEILTGVRYAMLPKAYLSQVEADRRYLAIEPAAGQTLAEALRTGLEPERALSLVVQLAQVVRRLHQAGWAVLGLTPADVVLGQPLELGHLGHAARIGEQPARAFQLAGYSAPELTAREPVTGKEDVYTLGAVLYQALAGQPLPESGVDVSELSTAIRVPGVPQLLADVLVPAEDRVDLDVLYARLLALRQHLTAQPLTLEIASATTLGLNPTRLVNEDSCGHVAWARAGATGAVDCALLCVADGMGGMEAGEVASQTALEVVLRAAGRALASSTAPEPDVPHEPEAPDAGDGAATGASLDPVALIREAATAVHAAADGRNLGTTITCVVVQDGTLTLGHVGDTRAYLSRAGALTRLTNDHSLVAAMVASGVITAQQAHGHPDSNKVLRSLGSHRELPPGYVDDLSTAHGSTSLKLEPGDWLLLCSDGVWGSVEDRQIEVVLREALDPQSAARALIDRALAAGAPDNASAVVARCSVRTVR